MLLGINVDHVATLRQARGTTEYPCPVEAALLAESSGADSIVMHLREDRRHIQDADLLNLKNKLKIELNLEMSINPGIVDFACELEPDKATIVPEKRQELTTEGGFDLIANEKKFKKIFDRLLVAGVEVSVFIYPTKKQIKKANELGVKIIELHTGKYADAKTKKQQQNELTKIKKAAEYASDLGIFVAAGHGLSVDNVKPIASIKQIEELNIGHSIISDSIFLGLKRSIKQIKKVIKS